MATGIVITVAEKLFAVLHSQELRDVCSMFGYESQLDDLKLTVSTIKSVLLDAESKHQELSHEGRDYIERLKEAVYHVDDLLDEFNTMVQKNKHIKGGNKVSKKVRRFFSRSNQLLVAYNMSHEIKNLRSKLDKIAKDRDQFGLSDVYVPVKRKQETMSFVGKDSIIGREDEREAIVKMLVGDAKSSNDVDQKVSYVSIVGIGGLGKTALAQMVYNDERVENAFESRSWVCVSDDFVLENIFCKMIKSNGFIEDLQNQVRNLIEGKKFLIALDDVWSESRDEWDKLKCFLDLGGRDSRVVITSRSKKVAKVIGSDLIHDLKGLSEENSWNLFKNLAFEPRKEPMSTSDPLFDIGKEIVKKCGNVPLAIRVAASMVFDQDERKWIALKNANLMEMVLGENGIMPILKYSYYHLTPALKSCFSFCALFPKDYRIKKETLVRLWLAQGCLDQPRDYQIEEDVGDEYFSILLQRCFLQEAVYDDYGEIKYCKMHDLIHDLAQEVAGKETILLESPKGLLEKSIHLSFTIDGLQLLASPLTQLGTIKTLRTFLTTSIFGSKNSLESNVFTICSHLKRLRVLALSALSFNALPDSVGNLSHLRYLDLSGHEELTVLPNSITGLYNLQVLDLDYTGVRELPLDTRKLVNLRHLSLCYCTHLTHMPPGLDTLTSLQTLTRFVVGNEASDGGNIGKLRDLSALVNLRGELNIIFHNDSSCDVANYRQVELLRRAHLKELLIQFNERGTIDETLLGCLHPHSRLAYIKIQSYNGLKLPSWVKYLGTSLPNLVKIHLTNFDNLQILPPLSQLHHLKYLKLNGMPNVKFMEESIVVVSSSNDEPPFFLSLERLKLSKFPKLKGWWREDTSTVRGEMGSSSVVVPSFPSLRELTLKDCPSLTTLPSCPKLRGLNLYKCHETLTFFQNKSAVPALIPGHPTTRLGSTISADPSSISPSSGTLLYMDYVRTDNIIGTLDCLFGKSLGGVKDLTILDFGGERLSILEEKHAVYNYAIKSLGLIKCPNLKSLPRVVNHLTNLYIRGCENLELRDNQEGDVKMSWESLHLLSHLTLEYLPKLINLPNSLQYLTSLQSLCIYGCENLEAMPEWIKCLTSLQSLQIHGCHKLKSLPQAIAHVPTLKYLWIEGCEILEKRCRQPDGEDWPKIRHIPKLYIK